MFRLVNCLAHRVVGGQRPGQSRADVFHTRLSGNGANLQVVVSET
jgi:hypothetical protein